MYSTLPDRSIRLLQLSRPITGNGEIHCSLATFGLNDQPKYRALSYTWDHQMKVEKKATGILSIDSKAVLGPDLPRGPRRQHSIFCDGKKLPVGLNLFEALSQLFKQGLKGYIWVDAVCINQGDLKEKSSQVALMGLIYSQAQQVIIWLGREDENSKIAESMLSEYQDALLKIDTEDPGWQKHSRKITFLEDEKFFSECGMKTRPGSDWNCLLLFFQRPWFTRVWVFQEISLAQGSSYFNNDWAIKIYCGDLEFQWLSIFLMLLFLKVTGLCQGLEASLGQGFSLAPVVMKAFYTRSWLKPEDAVLRRYFFQLSGATNERENTVAFLEYLLYQLKECRSTDARDMVYALLGIVHQFKRDLRFELPKPNYCASVNQVYTDTMQFLLENKRSLSPFLLLNQKPLIQIHELPSWVPDFSDGDSGSPLLLTRCGNRYNALFAAKDDGSLPDLFINSDILHLPGIEWDVVEEVCQPFPPASLFDDSDLASGYFESWKLAFQTMTLCRRIPSIYQNGQERIEVLWRTMIADQDNSVEGYPALEEIGHEFRRWLARTYTLWTETASEAAGCRVEEVDHGFKVLRDLQDEFQSPFIPSQEDIISLRNELGRGRKHFFETGENTVFDIMRVRFAAIAASILHGRVLFRTRKGLLGLGPVGCQPGDTLWALHRGRLFYAMRAMPDEINHQYVGECYLHGFMNGEVLQSDDAAFKQLSIC